MLKIIAVRRPAVKVWGGLVLDASNLALRGRLGRQPVAALWMAMGSTAIIELAGAARADAIVIDMQHGLWDRMSLEAAVGTARTAAAVLVRVAENSAPAIGQALDAGAEGVIVPLVDDGAAAARAVTAARFPPQGRRSGGGVRPLAGGFLDYYTSATEHTVVGVMIETPCGVTNAAAIAQTPGVDFILIGTGDLAVSIGGGAGADARREDACRRVLKACRSAAIPCAIYTPTADDAIARVREGYAMVVAANDVAVVTQGFGEAMLRFRSAGAGRKSKSSLGERKARSSGRRG
jgi:2-keto-3-deoxy-L-rhamnonate aldolase RhmA